MAHDSQIKSNKNGRARSKRIENAAKKKKIIDSDSSSDDGSNSDTEEEDDMDAHEYRKLLSKIFPSKHLSNKIKAGEKLKKFADKFDDEEDISDTESDEDEEPVRRKRNNNKKADNKTNNNKINNKKSSNKRSNKTNIIFTIGNGHGLDESDDEWEDEDSDYDSDEDEDEDEDEDLSEDEDEEVSTDEDDDSEEDVSEDESETEVVSKKDKSPDISSADPTDALIQLRKLLEANPSDKSIQKCITVYEEDIQNRQVKLKKKSIKQKDKNMRIFKRIITDKNKTNDFTFYNKLDVEQQKRIIKEAREINKVTHIEKPYRMTLLESTIPVEFKSVAMKKINTLKHMEPGSGEYYKSKNWVDTFMRIPFDKYAGLPISIDDGVDKCHEFMENAQKTLDEAVYGLNDAKMQIMQMLGQLLTNPKAIGTAIAIHGPPGTGKTSLVKEGISKILNRPFAFIALGGATDSSFLDGHGYTYEGSTWGKIVQIIIDSKCMNPVIYFDELDKISDTARGEEIAGILTHLTDTSQNSQFHDKYFAEVNFDLSKCLFIFSYNDENKINPILKDRMYRIKTKGYLAKEKTVISNNYLLPKIREQVKFTPDEIVISNDVVSHIIDTHCNKEDGVRNLKRCLEIIHTKLNLYRLMKPGSNLFEGEMSLTVQFPFVVTKEIVDKLIKRESGPETWRSLYV